MKLIHLSDLHLGKRLCGFSLIGDQRDVLDQIVRISDEEQPDGILIAGDIYDKTIPPAEAVELFDGFLTKIRERRIPVMITSGNHDSAERLSFGARIMEDGGVFLSQVFRGSVRSVTLCDEAGPVDFYLLPFLKPALVRPFFPEQTIETYTDALRAVIESLPLNPSHRSVLLAHQFVKGSERSASEEEIVGGLDEVDASVFVPFSYTALGHLHRAQQAGSERVRYCGTPFPYSFAEAEHKKSVTVINLAGDAAVTIREVPLHPLHPLHVLTGTYDELTSRSFYQQTDYQESYLSLKLTDETEVPDAVGRLRAVYPRLAELRYAFLESAYEEEDGPELSAVRQSPEELFAGFFKNRLGREMNEEQTAFVAELCRKMREEEK